MFVNPSKVIDVLNPLPGEAVADFGCGSGHYTIEAARRVGKYGKVLAVDIQETALSSVRGQAQLANLPNIETIRADLEKPEATRLAGNSVNLVIISNILFQAEDKRQIVREGFRILKSGGKAAAVEWAAENQPARPSGGTGGFGPMMNSRISSQEAKNLFEAEGFVFESEFNPGEHHYGLVFKKP